MKKKTVTAPSTKGWLPKVKKVAGVAAFAALAVLKSGLKLPGKVVTAAQYLALLAGIVKQAPGGDE